MKVGRPAKTRRLAPGSRPKTAALAPGLLLLFGAWAALADPRPPPDELGPFAVGRSSFAIEDTSRARTLVIDAWYPIDAADAGGPASVYDLIFTGLPSQVAFDSPPVSSQGPFPLVVFSHGSNGIRFQSFFLCEQLASHGFVVVAPDHAGNTALDLILPGTPFETRDRPLDVSFLISHMLQRNDSSGDDFHARIDAGRIGVVGHSFGGFTALTMASGFADVPPDPRVGAIVPISPVSTALSEAQLESIRVPTLILGGTSDITTPIDPQSERAFAFVSARPRYRVDVLAAGHNSFTNVCDLGAALIGAGLPPSLLEFLLGSLEEGCGPDLIPIGEAQRATDLYATAFLLRQLTGDGRYTPFLNPGRARSEPVVFFQVPGRPTCGLGFEGGVLVGLLWAVRVRRVRAR